ncbi:hypothetical protein EIP91_006752 [Steccherinum ochraceum]|uniref:Uncharacterized protein n=1 Tax=Steccherinum ochraceum TaxID=92696 RepID=A0A4V2MVM3_9APHY|nr:hypothetical protein EIP91_006752 [Steccherinum ochraceum]
MPPPRPQDYAVAHFYHGIDNDPRFQGVGPAPVNEERQGDQPQAAPQSEVAKVDVEIPLNTSIPGAVVTTRAMSFPENILPADFISQLIHFMGLEKDSAKLGYKFHNEKKGDPAHELESEEDVRMAFQSFFTLQKRAISRKVLIQVKNLAPAPPPLAASSSKKRKQEQVQSEAEAKPELTGCKKELEILQSRLTCSVRGHRGENRWCYVDPKDPQNHHYLGIRELTLWAREAHNNGTDLSSEGFVLPNCSEFDKFREDKHSDAKRRKKDKAAPTVTIDAINLPPVTVNIPASQQSGYTPLTRDTHNTPTKRKVQRWADADDYDSDGGVTPISDILHALHRKMPASNFPQYEQKLKDEGIDYACNAVGLDSAFFASTVGMKKGAIGPFLRELRKGAAKKAAKDVIEVSD